MSARRTVRRSETRAAYADHLRKLIDADPPFTAADLELIRSALPPVPAEGAAA